MARSIIVALLALGCGGSGQGRIPDAHHGAQPPLADGGTVPPAPDRNLPLEAGHDASDVAGSKADVAGSPDLQVDAQTADARRSDAPTSAQAVGLYDVFEHRVTNPKRYANPFDFRAIELRTVFQAPSGRMVAFFGFHDGDGKGGQTGSVWAFRFMPDEVGAWRFTYTWTDGSPGGSGTFDVADQGLPGPVKLDPTNQQLLADARGNPIHFKGYSLHNQIPEVALTEQVATDWIRNKIDRFVIAPGYNAVMISLPSPSPRYDSRGRGLQTMDNGTDFLWGQGASQYSIFNTRAGRYLDLVLDHLKNNRIWTVSFTSFIFSYNTENVRAFFANPQPFLRWFVARYAPYYNFFVWTPAWEMDSTAGQKIGNWVQQVGDVMRYLVSIDPWRRPLGAHDTARPEWTDWQTVLPAQSPSQDAFIANRRDSWAGNGSINEYQKVIIAYENIWETADPRWQDDFKPGCENTDNLECPWSEPRNRTEVRRVTWGSLLANILPIYDEQTAQPVWIGPAGGAGNGVGEVDVLHAYSFYYGSTSYRQYRQLNALVSAAAGQIASGKPGSEYIVYDEDGGDITVNGLTGTFTVLWFNPIAPGSQQSGADVVARGSASLGRSPFGTSDTVVLLKCKAGATCSQ